MKFAVLICLFTFYLGVNAQTHRLSSQATNGSNTSSSVHQNYQNHRSTQNFRQNVHQNYNQPSKTDYRVDFNYYNTGSGLDRSKKDFRKNRAEAIKKQNFEEANRKSNWKRNARIQQMIFDECIAEIYLEIAARSQVEKEIVTVHLLGNEVYVVPENQTWHIWNKNLNVGESVSIYSNSGKDIAIKAYPKSDNSIVLVKGENESDQKILIQKYLELQSGTIVKISDDTQAYINLK